MDAPQAPSPPKNGFILTGPALVGITLNWFLFGILVMQYLMYCSHVAKRDKKILQAIVHIIFVLDTAQTVMVMVDGFRFFVYNYGNYDAMLEFGIAGIDSPLMDGLIALIVQCVYAWRIWVLGRSKVVSGIIAFLAFVGGINGMVDGILDTIQQANTPNPSWFIPNMLWLWTSLANDILIAVSMTYLLRTKSAGVRGGATTVVNRLLALTIETNAVTALVALATAVVLVNPHLVPPATNVHLAGGYTLGKFYSNCFMVLLNQRVYYDDTRRTHDRLSTVGTFSAASRKVHSEGTISNPNEEISRVHLTDSSDHYELKSNV